VRLLIKNDCFILNVIRILRYFHSLVELYHYQSTWFYTKDICSWPLLLLSYLLKITLQNLVDGEAGCESASELNQHRVCGCQIEIVGESRFDCLILRFADNYQLGDYPCAVIVCKECFVELDCNRYGTVVWIQDIRQL
jgi:hypothetical protein